MKKLQTIDLGGKKYPIKCDIDVLEQLQEEYGTLTVFEQKLQGWNPVFDENGVQKLNENGDPLFEVIEPSIKAIKFTLIAMLQEGIDIYNETHDKKLEMLSEKEIIRAIDSPFTVSIQLYDEYLNSLNVKDPNELMEDTKESK